MRKKRGKKRRNLKRILDNFQRNLSAIEHQLPTALQKYFKRSAAANKAR